MIQRDGRRPRLRRCTTVLAYLAFLLGIAVPQARTSRSPERRAATAVVASVTAHPHAHATPGTAGDLPAAIRILHQRRRDPDLGAHAAALTSASPCVALRLERPNTRPPAAPQHLSASVVLRV